MGSCLNENLPVGWGGTSVDDSCFVNNEDLSWMPRIQIRKSGDLIVSPSTRDAGQKDPAALQPASQPALATGCAP